MNGEAACLLARLPGAGGFRQALPESNTLALARRGDPSAFDELVHRHQGRIYNLAYRMLRQTEDAEDVTQEAFLKAFEALPRLQNDLAFGSWLCRIAANLCLARLRSPARRAEMPTDPSATPWESAPVGDWPNLEVIADAREAVATLPPKYRLAVVAFYIQGRSYEEGARLAGVPALTFKTWLYRARKMLRRTLGDSLDGMTEGM